MTFAQQANELDDWMQAALTSTAELATAIGLGACHESPTPTVQCSDPSGAHIPLVGQRVSVQVGFQSTPEGCRLLAKLLLGMSDEDLSPDIVSDATCEIANMLAGLVKRRMTHMDSSLRLGLPIFVEGRVHPGPGITANTRFLHIGDVPLTVAVFHPRS